MNHCDKPAEVRPIKPYPGGFAPYEISNTHPFVEVLASSFHSWIQLEREGAEYVG